MSRTGLVLIQPGETYRQTFRYSTTLSPVSTGEVPPMVSNLVLNITSLVFTDGSYEGDSYPAATFLAGKLGEKAQLRAFLDRVRAGGSISSESDVEVAISAVDLDGLAAEIIKRFPDLTAAEKVQVRYAVGSGQSFGVKSFRTASVDPNGTLAELLQARIDALP